MSAESSDAGLGKLFPAYYELRHNHRVLGRVLDTALATSELMAMGLEFDDKSKTPWFSLQSIVQSHVFVYLEESEHGLAAQEICTLP